MATKRPRYMISVDDEMFNAIENFRFENRFQTRSEATAELIRLGLESLNNNSKRDISIKTEMSQPAQKPLEEMSLEELGVERKKVEAEYIKSKSKSVSNTITSTVLNSTADIQNLKNTNISGKVSNQ